MTELFFTAYIAALLLWIPLGILAVLKPSARKRVMVPLAMSVIGAIYEIWMRAAFSAQVIRIDILLAMFILGGVDAISGLTLLLGARDRPDRGALTFAGALCLVIPALAIAGFGAIKLDIANVDRDLDLSRRYRFEAYFRDDETQKRVYGDLKPDKNPWAGYYAYAGGMEDRFAHLVINDDGRFWIYHSVLSLTTGNGTSTADSFEGAGDTSIFPRMRMKLRRQGGGPYLLEVNFSGNIGDSTPVAPMLKRDAPRFPRPATANDEVRFAGIFSATYGEKDGHFWLIEVWLWESGGQWWGQYIRDAYNRGQVREFISTEKIEPACSEQCKVLSFATSRGPARLTLVSPDEIVATVQGERESVTLKREETLPGFFLDLAPLATKKENRDWLKAMTTAGMISWNVPSAAN